ncbi:MAG: metallophosphoesterase family protein [Chloroflexi bacterium]|nr:metallophosphoesterase family protein [Chloroflexota bacterium]
MRIAAYSDIHGNPIALEAVLTDIEAQGGVDQTIVVGDLAAIGPAPVEVLERLAAVENTIFVRGNTETYLLTNTVPPPSTEDVQRDPSLAELATSVARSFGWTQGAITQAGWLDWMVDLPLEQRLSLPDGTRLLAVHAAPGRDDGPGVEPLTPKETLEDWVKGCDADLVLVGHVHQAGDYPLTQVRIVNVASVGNPMEADLKASWVLIEADQNGYDLTFYRVDYDREAVIDLTHRVRQPAAEYIISFLKGEKVRSA